MALTIELSTEQEARLADAARRQGMEPATLAQLWVIEHLPGQQYVAGNGNGTGNQNHFYFTATDKEWETAMDELAAGGENLPMLSEEAFDRENLYEDRI
jgi:hypothetical protein